MSKKLKHHLCLIIDESGSMASIHTAALNHINEQIEAANSQSEDFDIYVTLCFFNHDIDFKLINKPINKLKRITGKDYIPSGTTALYDAIGHSIEELKKLPDIKDTDVLVAIVTDGYENASTRFKASDISEHIQTMKTKHGWTFVFMGANIDVDNLGSELNFSNANTMGFAADAAGTKGMTQKVTCGLENYYNTRSMQFSSVSDDADDGDESIGSRLGGAQDDFFTSTSTDESKGDNNG